MKKKENLILSKGERKKDQKSVENKSKRRIKCEIDHIKVVDLKKKKIL